MFFRRRQKVKRPLYRRIINAFIYFGVGLIALLMITFALTQTSTFRNWLRETVIEQVNSSTNGQLFIERIDGTVFTSFILNNTTLTLEGDTILNAGKIEVKTSPLKILFKIIYFRKIEIKDATIALLKDENGELNISRLVPPSEEPEDEEPSEFNWKLQVADFSLNGVNLKLQSYNYKNSNAFYDVINFDDLRVNDLNLSLAAFADIKGSEFAITIDNFSAKPNLNYFKLNDLSGKFLLVDDKAGVTDLNLVTDRSQISVSAAISDYKLLGEDKRRKIEDAFMRIDLAATDFNFDNLTSFIDATYLLKGNVTTHVSASGSLNNLVLEKLIVELQDSRLEATGKLRHITRGDKMIINTVFTDSYINQNDANNLLHTIELPVYEELGILTFSGLSFVGSPLNFNSGIKLKTDKGNLTASAHLNLEKDEFEYDINIETRNFDISPFAGVASDLNSEGSLKGVGFSPGTIIAQFKLNADGSTIDNNYFQNLDIEADGYNGIIKTGFSFVSGNADGSINVNLDITDESKPSYKFTAGVNGFDIRSLFDESDIPSDLNFFLEGEGENFNQDDLNLFASLIIDNSTIRGLKIDSTRTIVDIRSETDQRVINVISDLADITLSGNFKIADLVSLVSTESKTLSTALTNKLERIQPPEFIDNTKIDDLQDEEYDEDFFAESLSSEVDLNYALEFKDFELLSLILGGSKIEIDGELYGKLTIFNDSIAANINTNLDYFKFWDRKELIYLSQFDLEFSFSDKLSSTDLTGFETEVNLKVRKVFFGSEFENLFLDLGYKNNIATIDFNVVMEEIIRAEIDGIVDISGDKVSVLLDDLLFSYNDYTLVNRNKIDLSYSENQINFNQFTLTHNRGEIILSGTLSTEGQHNLSLNLNDIEGKDLSTGFLGLHPHESFHGLINLSAQLNGVAGFPELNLDLNIDNFAYINQPLGSLTSSIGYANQQLTADIKLVKGVLQNDKPNLIFSGNIPIDLALKSGGTLLTDKNVFLSLKAAELDLAPFGSTVSQIHQMRGKFNAEVSATGTLENLNTFGFININNASFVLQANRLKYYTGLDLKFDEDRIELSNLYIKNSDETKDSSTLTGHGYLTHRNFLPSEVEISLSGMLKLLSRSSRSANPSFYGDLVIETRDDLVYKLNENQNQLTADLILKKGANVTFSPTNSAFTNETDKFVYHFKSEVDSVGDNEIDSLIIISESVSKELKASSKTPFDIDIKIEVEDEARMDFVLSREFNQNLTAYLGGNFEYTVVNNKPLAQGELVLLEGSKLDFIKTFQAEGSIRFLSELDNPYLDVVGTYQNYYDADTSRTSINEYEVQVRIKLEGPVKSLNTNFIEDDNNIEIYKRPTNRGQFELDATKDASDAMMFIIVGKFTEDASMQETNFAVSTAASLAGSIVGGFLNDKLGDYVRSVQVRQVGTETKFSLIGKAGDFRYEIGGTSQIFQDFSRANVKIEWPVIPITPRLILRLERREPIFESSTYSEMINELGVKYSFQF